MEVNSMKLKSIMAIGCIALVVFAVGLFTIEIFGASPEACVEYCMEKYGGYESYPFLNPLVLICYNGCIYGSQL